MVHLLTNISLKFTFCNLTPANFTNCRNQPCLNGGTCYFNFQRFADDCTCSKYYTEKDCGLYLGEQILTLLQISSSFDRYQNLLNSQNTKRNLLCSISSILIRLRVCSFVLIRIRIGSDPRSLRLW